MNNHFNEFAQHGITLAQSGEHREVKKVTIRLDGRNQAFYEELVHKLPHCSALTEVITRVLDHYTQYCTNPLQPAIDGASRLLAAFGTHGVHNIRILELLTLLGIEKPSLMALSSPATFYAALSAESCTTLCRFFGMTEAYLNGEATSPHCIENILHPKQFDVISQINNPSMQPELSLIRITCHEESLDDALWYVQSRLALNPSQRVTAYIPVGRLICSSDSDRELHDAALAGAASAKIPTFEFTIDKTTMVYLRHGHFVANYQIFARASSRPLLLSGAA